MANKVGILNGILLVILNFFSVIPLGIYFGIGLSSYTGIPLMFAQDGITAVYAWGILDIALSNGTWWLRLGVMGISGFILEIVLVVSCILSFIGSWIEGNGGRKMMVIILIMEILSFVFILLDILVIGTLGLVVTISELFSSLGIGMYLLIIIILLQIIALKIHNINL